MSDELKPCPFCGVIPSFSKSNDRPPYYRVDHYCPHDTKYPFNMHVDTKWCRTEDKAMDLWNRRV
jgi:hypothetical protein